MKENKTIKIVSEEEMGIGNETKINKINLVPEEDLHKRIYNIEDKIKENELRIEHGLSINTAKNYNLYITKFEEWNSEQIAEIQSLSTEERIKKFLAVKMEEVYFRFIISDKRAPVEYNYDFGTGQGNVSTI